MDKGIPLRKELAMGMDSAKKEAVGKVKLAQGGMVGKPCACQKKKRKSK